MFNILNQAYPAPSADKKSLVISVLFGLFIGLFLLFFEPFGIDTSSVKAAFLNTLPFGLITFITVFCGVFLFPHYFPNFFQDANWCVKNQIMYYTLILLAIATFNGIYTNFINNLAFSWSNYWWIISRTFVLGSIPISIITLVDFNQKNSANSSLAKQITLGKENNVNTNKCFNLTTALKGEQLSFSEEQFSFAVAVGNYVDVYLSTPSAELSRTTLRLSLSSLEEQLQSSTDIVRCHRSYIVHLQKVIAVTGNAQGLKLSMTNTTEVVSVSRKYIQLIKRYYKTNTI